MPVIRLSANTEVSVSWVETQMKKNEPRMARPPTIIGRPAEISEPKTKISRIMVSGIAIDSATARSVEMAPLIAALMGA